MKIKATISKTEVIEVDDKFLPLLAEDNPILLDELYDFILENDEVNGVIAVWSEDDTVCIGEC